MLVVILWRCRLGRGSWSPRRSKTEVWRLWLWMWKAKANDLSRWCSQWLTEVVSSILLYFSISPHIQSRVQSWLTMRPRCQSYRISPSGNLGSLLLRDEGSGAAQKDQQLLLRPLVVLIAHQRLWTQLSKFWNGFNKEPLLSLHSDEQSNFSVQFTHI